MFNRLFRNCGPPRTYFILYFLIRSNSRKKLLCCFSAKSTLSARSTKINWFWVQKTVAVVVAVVVAAIFSSLLLPRKFWVSSERIWPILNFWGNLKMTKHHSFLATSSPATRHFRSKLNFIAAWKHGSTNTACSKEYETI